MKNGTKIEKKETLISINFCKNSQTKWLPLTTYRIKSNRKHYSFFISSSFLSKSYNLSLMRIELDRICLAQAYEAAV